MELPQNKNIFIILNIPIEMTATDKLSIAIKSNTSKAEKFIKKINKLCRKYKYRINIENRSDKSDLYENIKAQVIEQHKSNLEIPIDALVLNEMQKDENQHDIEDTCMIFDITKSELAQNISFAIMEGMKNDKPNQENK